MRQINKISIYFIIYFIISAFSVTVDALAYAMDEDVMYTLNNASGYACELIEAEPFDIALEVNSGEEVGNKVYCIFNQSEYDKLNKMQKKDYLSHVMDKVTKGEDSLNSAQLQQAYNFLVGVDDRYINEAVNELLNDGNNNLLTAVSWLAPIMPYVNIVFAILVISALVLTCGMTLVDIVYLSLPFFSSQGRDDKKPKFITNEAYRALTEQADKGGNVYGVYFKKRIVAMLIIMVCSGIILSGRLADFVSMVVGLFL